VSTLLRAAAKPVYIHATAVVIGDAGLLIRGPSRAGKSSLALVLLAEAARLSCFARLIGDDRISVERQGNILILRGHPAIQGKIEDRGHGILDVPWAPCAVARYVIELVPLGAQAAPAAATGIEGVELPLLTLPPNLTAAERAALLMTVIQKNDIMGDCLTASGPR
jgi:HPr kinase/phosphorylase